MQTETKSKHLRVSFILCSSLFLEFLAISQHTNFLHFCVLPPLSFSFWYLPPDRLILDNIVDVWQLMNMTNDNHVWTQPNIQMKINVWLGCTSSFVHFYSEINKSNIESFLLQRLNPALSHLQANPSNDRSHGNGTVAHSHHLSHSGLWGCGAQNRLWQISVSLHWSHGNYNLGFLLRNWSLLCMLRTIKQHTWSLSHSCYFSFKWLLWLLISQLFSQCF